MDHLGFLTNFLVGIDEGSLSAGARRTGITQPAISQQMTALEQYYGCKLLQRSKSGARPTNAGKIVCRYALQMQETHNRLLAELDTLGGSTAGRLKISTSQAIAELVLGEVISDLHQTNPDLDVLMQVENRVVDVVRESYDFAIRIGSQGQSDGVVRKIGALDIVLVASPAYLDANGRPNRLDQIEKLNFIEFSIGGADGFIYASKDGVDVQIPVHIGFRADAPNLMQQALLRGIGLARMPRVSVQHLLDQGGLEIVMPGYQMAQRPVYIVHPHRNSLNRRALLFIDALLKKMAATDHMHALRFP